MKHISALKVNDFSLESSNQCCVHRTRTQMATVTRQQKCECSDKCREPFHTPSKARANHFLGASWFFTLSIVSGGWRFQRSFPRKTKIRKSSSQPHGLCTQTHAGIKVRSALPFPFSRSGGWFHSNRLKFVQKT